MLGLAGLVDELHRIVDAQLGLAWQCPNAALNILRLLQPLYILRGQIYKVLILLLNFDHERQVEDGTDEDRSKAGPLLADQCHARENEHLPWPHVRLHGRQRHPAPLS